MTSSQTSMKPTGSQPSVPSPHHDGDEVIEQGVTECAPNPTFDPRALVSSGSAFRTETRQMPVVPKDRPDADNRISM
jgi:hypothetical protein